MIIRDVASGMMPLQSALLYSTYCVALDYSTSKQLEHCCHHCCHQRSRVIELYYQGINSQKLSLRVHFSSSFHGRFRSIRARCQFVPACSIGPHSPISMAPSRSLLLCAFTINACCRNGAGSGISLMAIGM